MASLGRWNAVDPLADAPHLVGWSPYHYTYNNPINYIDPDGRSPIKGLKALFNVGRRAYKTYKKTGKFNAKTVGKGLKDELVNIVDNASTLLNGNLNADDAFAIIDLATGFGGEAKKLLKGADKAGDAKKATKGARTEPKDLQEKLTLDEAKGGAGEPIMQGRLKDSKYDTKTGTHDKMGHNHDHGDGTSTEVHYDRNRSTGEGSGYKIKDDTNKNSRGNQ